MGLLLITAFLLVVQDSEPPEVRGGGKGVTMDYGPFLTSTVSRVKFKRESDVLASKAITIRVGKDASYCFDPDLLRAAGGWTGGFLDLSNTHLTSYKGSLPTTVKGSLVFATAAEPGWTIDGNDALTRAVPSGPLPAKVARYQGLYRSGDRMVLSYRVGDCDILELPEYENGIFARTLRLGPSKSTLTLRAADEEPKVRVAVWNDGKANVELLGLHRIKVAPHAVPALLRVRLSRGGEDLASPVFDPSTLTRGGPARWPEPLVTAGVVAKDDAAYVVDTVTVPDKNPWDAWLRFTGLDFFSDGRAAMCTWNGDVWVCSGIDAGLAKLEWRRVAAGLYEPLGLRVVDDKICVHGRDQITRLHDLNGDGEADFYENVWNGHHTMANYHAFTFELHTDSQGNFVVAVDGHRVDSDVPLHGCVLRIAKDGRSEEVVARGFRAPNGMSVGPNDEITVSDNQGNWMPSSKVSLIKPGGFYGYVPHSGRKEEPKTFDPPICWIPMALDNSSGGQAWVTSDAWGPLKGSLLHTSYGTGSLFLVPFEEIAGVPQGGVVRFPLAFQTGILRARFHPKDGQLYVAGLRGWQTTGVRDAGLQRVRYTGKPATLVSGLRATKTGVVLTFTDPVDAETAKDVDSWGVLRWNYLWSEKYGSPDFWVSNPKKQGREPVEVKSIQVSADGRNVTLELEDFRPAMQMLLKARLRSPEGRPVPVDVALTVNAVP